MKHLIVTPTAPESSTKSRYGRGMNPVDHELLRERVRSAVIGRDPIDETEASVIAAFVEEFDALEDPFDQELDPIHVTGSAIVVGPRGTVLLKHKRLGLWLQPGGHLDRGEAPWDAALREAMEETGLPLRFAELGPDSIPRLVHVDVHPGGRGHTHLDLRYLLVVDTESGDADPNPPDGESQELGWFDRDAALERASDDRLRSALATLLTS